MTTKTKTAPVATEETKLPDWEIMLSVVNPDPVKPRPRRTSLHTLAYVLGRKDPLALAAEMASSDKVVGYVCPDVRTPIFYLKSMAHYPTMIDTRDASVWGTWRYPSAGATSLADFVAKNPFPAIKGFKRFKTPNAMSLPYEAPDFPYARLIIKALTDAGYTPGLTEADLVEPKS